MFLQRIILGELENLLVVGFAWFSLISAPVTLVLIVLAGFFGVGEYMDLVERFMVSYFQVSHFIVPVNITWTKFMPKIM